MLYDALQCRNRLLAIHQLREDFGSDALVTILGSDARNCRGAELLFSYLILGKSGTSLMLEALDYDLAAEEVRKLTSVPAKAISGYQKYDAATVVTAAESVGTRGAHTAADGAAGAVPAGGFLGQNQAPRSFANSCISDWDEVVLILHRDFNRIFAPNHTIATRLQKLCCLWPNLEITTPADWNPDLENKEIFKKDPKSFREDKLGDRYDDMKINFFIDAVSLASTNILGFFGDNVESWSLVQAYALDDYGGHGFLTLKKKVLNLFSELPNFFSIVDVSVVESLKLESLDTAWSEAVKNLANQDACVQHYLYGVMNRDELVDVLNLSDEEKSKILDSMKGEKGEHPFINEVKELDVPLEACFNEEYQKTDGILIHEVVDPDTGVFFARTLPELALCKNYRHIDVAKKCVDFFVENCTNGFGDDTLNTGDEPFLANFNREDLGTITRQYKQHLQLYKSKLGLVEEGVKLESMQIRKINSYGLPGAVSNTDSSNSVNASTTLIAVRVRIGNTVWGDTFAYSKVSPNDKKPTVCKLTSERYLAAFIVRSGDLIVSGNSSFTTSDTTSTSIDSTTLKACTDMVFMGTFVLDANLGSVTLFRDSNKSYRIAYRSKMIKLDLGIDERETDLYDDGSGVYCRAHLIKNPRLSVYVKIPFSWCASLKLKVRNSLSEVVETIQKSGSDRVDDVELVKLWQLVCMNQATNRKTGATVSFQNWSKTAMVADAHLGRMPPRSLRCLVKDSMGKTSVASAKKTKEKDNADKDSYKTPKVIWINTLAGGRGAKKLGRQLQKDIFLKNNTSGSNVQGRCISLRDLLFEQSGPRSQSVGCNEILPGLQKLIQSVGERESVSIINDIGLPTMSLWNSSSGLSVDDVYVITDMRDSLNGFSKDRYQYSSWGKALVDYGSCDAVILPVQDAVSNDVRLATKLAEIEKWVLHVNPDVHIVRGYTNAISEKTFFSNGTMKTLQKRLLSRPGCMDATAIEREAFNTVKGTLYCVYLPVDSKCYVREELEKTLLTLVRDPVVVAIETNVRVLSMDLFPQKKTISRYRGVIHSTSELRLLNDDESREASTTAGASKDVSSAVSDFGFAGRCPDTRLVLLPKEEADEIWPGIMVWLLNTTASIPTSCSENDTENEREVLDLRQLGEYEKKLMAKFDETLLNLPTNAELESLPKINDTEIRSLARKTPLSDGWHFDGEWYIDFQGQRFLDHPKINEILQEEIQRRQLQLSKKNYEYKKFMSEVAGIAVCEN